MGAPSQTEGGTGGQEVEAKKYTTTEKNWQHRAKHGLGLGSEFIDSGKTMVIAKVGEPYRDGRHLLIDTWAIEKQAVSLAAAILPEKKSIGKRGRFREYIEKKRDT